MIANAHRTERGQVTVFVLTLFIALIGTAGLVIDGGLGLAGRVRAMDEAQAAARAGAQAVDQPSYRRTGKVVLDNAAAVGAAQLYIAATGDSADVTVSGDRLHVTVRHTQPMQILSVLGLRSLTLSGDGEARAEQGVVAAAP